MPDGSALRVGLSLLGVALMHQLWRRARSRLAASASAHLRASAFGRPLPPFVAALADVTVVSDLESARRASGGAKLIGTHDGAFHCDEALACAMLKMLPEFDQAVVVRSRDPKILDACDIVVDVGAVYDPARHRYDHHQREFTGVMANLGHKTKLSSAGLVYRHFGPKVVARLAETTSRGSIGTAPPDVDALYSKVYRSFIEHIDGIDNGVEAFEGGTRNYEVPTTLSARVGLLNPRWNEPAGPTEANAGFREAVALAGSEFAAAVEAATTSWWPARAIVAAALDGAADVHPSRQILLLKQACPWQAHIFELEEERAAAGDAAIRGAAKYVVFGDSKGSDWRIQAVPVEEQSFATRRALPEPWRGVRDAKLSELLGLDGCIFVHASGFIGGHATREGALAMAIKAIGT